MPSILHLTLSIAALAVLAGCATQQSGNSGKHLVYRDGNGQVVRQFDYPDDSFCRRVQSMAGRGAHCEAAPATGTTAQATLRYNPPGVTVTGHYSDMARCQADTKTMSAGVELINGCTAK